MSNDLSFSLRTEYITLGQLLKAASIVSTGGEGKEMLTAGGMLVNGESDNRRGRKLRVGDVVTLPDGRTINIS